MKLIFICWLAAIMPILYYASDDSINNASINSPAVALHQISGRNGDLTSFKENKVLINEFADIIEEYRRGSMNAKRIIFPTRSEDIFTHSLVLISRTLVALF